MLTEFLLTWYKLELFEKRDLQLGSLFNKIDLYINLCRIFSVGDWYGSAQWVPSLGKVVLEYIRTKSDMMIHSFSPSIWRQRQEDLYEFKVYLIYKASFKTARVITQRSPILKRKCCWVVVYETLTLALRNRQTVTAFKTSLSYSVSSRRARATQRNSLKKQKNKQTTTTKNK